MNYPEYRDFRDGQLSRDVYSKWVEGNATELSAAGLNRDQMNLSTRFPRDDRAFVGDILSSLQERKVIPAAGYPFETFASLNDRVTSEFDHGGRMTYIFPEEALLIYGLASILKPTHAVFAGSYYGFWAIWAVEAIVAGGGRVTLIDVDPAVMRLAERNFERLGMADRVDFAATDAITYSRTQSQDIDFVALDAEGPKTGASPDFTDKAIYYPITEAIAPAMTPGSILLAHNVLLQNLTANSYFEERIAYNELQYTRWHGYLTEHFDFRESYPSTEGVGIYRKAR